MKQDADYAKAVEEAQDIVYDMIEKKIHEKVVVLEDTTMQIFYAKTKMRHRGYSERMEIDANVHIDTSAISNASTEELTNLHKSLID